MTSQMENPGRKTLRSVAWSAAVVLLLLPLVAMQFTEEVQWGAGDFIIFGTILLGSGLLLEMVFRRSASRTYRLAAGLALFSGFGLIMVNGAVGIIGNENNDANLMYVGVLAIAVGGSVLVRFQPRGLARAMTVTVFTQVLVGAIALVAGWGSGGAIWPWDIIGGTIIFTGLWMMSARMFRKAAEEPAIRGVE